MALILAKVVIRLKNIHIYYDRMQIERERPAVNTNNYHEVGAGRDSGKLQMRL